jgi:hypothetical protein
MLVKVTFKPWEEVIIHEVIYYSFEDIVKLFSLGIQPGGLAQSLFWAEGVIFSHVGIPPTTNEVAREQLDGKIHWSSVSWALMPKYQAFIPIKDINAKIPIVDVSSNSILCEAAKALKGQVK